MAVVQAVRAGDEAGTRGFGLRDHQQRSLRFQPVDERVQKRPDAFLSRCAGTEGRRAVDEGCLELALLLVQQRLGQRATVGEAPVDRANADACLGGDFVKSEAFDSADGDQVCRRTQDLLPVAGRVGPLDRVASGDRESHAGSLPLD
jgi:hypothetical protein